MNLYVVRHGETDANAEQRYLGALDVALNANGKAQAQELRLSIPSDVKIAIVSPLLRAQQTAEIIFKDCDLPVLTVYGFRERNVGVFEGLTQTQARTQYPDLWRKNITRAWNDAPTNGESIKDVVTRVGYELNQLIAAYPGESVVLIAHGFVAKTIRALAHQDFSDFFDWQLSNGCLLHVHLPEQFSPDFEHLMQTLPVQSAQ
ncbi:putative phosphoglycerate mutase [Herbaspirillum rubrisubalbicans]|uniref:histidine phosphatase family protein n=1 Tax=Herbaspirillum rubrisubalbicans TaxID=80842 RepID=UPI0020A16A0D|nr:histidine phosphatase family protein [Herbaspirillum rubrisubalbicans]MCP1572308.1 putative phosphoglycerate mutase [Herbaspirillum rubrisubalbicans]